MLNNSLLLKVFSGLWLAPPAAWKNFHHLVFFQNCLGGASYKPTPTLSKYGPSGLFEPTLAPAGRWCEPPLPPFLPLSSIFSPSYFFGTHIRWATTVLGVHCHLGPWGWMSWSLRDSCGHPVCFRLYGYLAAGVSTWPSLSLSLPLSLSLSLSLLYSTVRQVSLSLSAFAWTSTYERSTPSLLPHVEAHVTLSDEKNTDVNISLSSPINFESV